MDPSDWPTQPALSVKASGSGPLWKAVSRITPSPSRIKVMSDAAPISLAIEEGSKSPSEVCGDVNVLTGLKLHWYTIHALSERRRRACPECSYALTV